MSKSYLVKEKVNGKVAKELLEYDKLIAQLLYNRGIKTKKEAEVFLNPDFTKHLHDPFLLPDMKKGVTRILKAIKDNDRIGIWSDYDADGIPGGAILHDFFKLIGFNNFINYIPDRHLEGYGLNIDGVEELAKDNVKLLITIDCGIRDIKEIALAKSLGIETIITDHHEEGSDLPKALAIINPKLSISKYPEKVLCGSGVIWKLIEAILQTDRGLAKEGHEKWLLDLVGIATLSDMVPLTGENRVLSYYGLSVLRKNRRLGLQKLFSMLRINKNFLTEDDISFLITPRINAASRMGHPRDAFNLLTCTHESEATDHAKHLDAINNERKGIVASMVKETKKKIKEKINSFGEKSVIVLGNPDWRPALLGLVANSIAEEYNRPVFLWGREGGEFIKGSCRSDGTTDLVAIMEGAKESFLEFGGHKLSGGFSVHHEKIHTLEDSLIEASTHIVKEDTEIEVDAEINLNDIDQNFINKLEQLAPFGIGNEKPTFIIKNIIPEKINRFGKTKEHLSINMRGGLKTLKAISFFTPPDHFGDMLKEGIATNIVANIEKSYWNGSAEIRARIIDFF